MIYYVLLPWPHIMLGICRCLSAFWLPTSDSCLETKTLKDSILATATARSNDIIWKIQNLPQLRRSYCSHPEMSELFYGHTWEGRHLLFPVCSGHGPGGGVLPNFQYGGSMPVFLCWPLNIESNALETPSIVIYFYSGSWRPQMWLFIALYINGWTLTYRAYEWLNLSL